MMSKSVLVIKHFGLRKGRVIVFGSVSEPQGTFGIAVTQLEDDADTNALGTNDPTIKANAGALGSKSRKWYYDRAVPDNLSIGLG